MYRNLALIGMFAVALTATQASSADKQDQAFIKDAIEGNLAEVQMGELAQDKGQSDAVKSFGQMLVNDHGNANQTATSVANQIGVTPPTEPNKTQKAMYDKLSKLTGDAFVDNLRRRWWPITKRIFRSTSELQRKRTTP